MTSTASGRVLPRLRDAVDARRDPVAFARRLGVSVGNDCRLLSISRGTFGSEPYLVTLGDHVTVTAGVRFITHDGGVWVLREQHPRLDVFGDIEVGSNVFIGLNALLLPGARLGDDVVVGAGAVVTKPVASGSVVAGNPARLICSFEDYSKRALSAGMHIRGKEASTKAAVVKAHFGRTDLDG